MQSVCLEIRTDKQQSTNTKFLTTHLTYGSVENMFDPASVCI